ncbi:ADP-ribose glycohydrolase OARD1 [Cololabis saira]|uniref:ADP-ribose glycohydrolase OARD1 n=1 Tax=Cololabis saira TaxID=129043 RepID=UPI002AD4F18E|nr:ADP-ribose glycohydrolase OARD1 [Cololabis saira]
MQTFRFVCLRLLTPHQASRQHLNSLLVMSTAAQTPACTGTVTPAECSWKPQYVSGDLFSCPADEALAHCISEDCHMGAGIALLFKRKFKGVPELKEQNKVQGQCAVLTRNQRFIYYLITKKKYSQKPTYDSLRQSLEDMRAHCVDNKVMGISMPRIGCGLDRLQWPKVSEILEEVFKDTNITITVYSLPEKAETTVMTENMRR